MPESNDDSGWSPADMLAMFAAQTSNRQSADPGYYEFPVELSGGDHHGSDEYFMDPDYFEMLGMSDPSELTKRKTDISR